ncbi:MAG TPA: hypothetical protein VFX61_03795 [Micromonosporaceae bacterium]|nr:hypothetical protein [Micromonosporaceae bacterium]
MSCWKPEVVAPVRPNLQEPPGHGVDRPGALDELRLNARVRIMYLRSYLVMRAALGFLGIGLPFLLLGGDLILAKGAARVRDSLSAYYYSGMRDVFVGVLVAAGIFLITYKVVERNLDNTLSMLAGGAVLGVALFPAARPNADVGPLTPLQEALGETPVAFVHFACAAVFILSLAVISFLFGLREGKRAQQRDGQWVKMSPTFWRHFHWACATVIVLAVAFVAATKLFTWFDNYSLLVGESVAVFAFGSSWLMKGLELDVFRKREPAKPEPRQEAALGAP